MKINVLIPAVLLGLSAVSSANAEEVNYQKLYSEMVPKYHQANNHVKMLQRQTREYRRILDRLGYDYSQEIVTMGDDGVIVNRVDLSEAPWPVDLRTPEEKRTN